MNSEIVIRAKSQEEIAFQRFCDSVDEHNRLIGGKPQIAFSEDERRARFMAYLLRSTEIMDWMIKLLGDLDTLNRLIPSSVLKKEADEPTARTRIGQPSTKGRRAGVVSKK